MKKIVFGSLGAVAIGLMVFNFSADVQKRSASATSLSNIQAMTASAFGSECDARNTNECYPPQGGKGTGALIVN